MAVSPQFGKSIFICSKPLQVLICASIVRSYSLLGSELYIISPKIADAEAFLQFLRSSSYRDLFAAIHTCNDHRDAIRKFSSVRYESLFVEDDRVSLYLLFKPMKRRYLVVFEEGFGTYRDDYRERLTFLRRTKWIALSAVTGCGLYFGHGRETDHVMVQFPDTYGRLNPNTAPKALPIPSLTAEFTNAHADWKRVTDAALPPLLNTDARTAALVLGTWGGAPSERLRTITSMYDVVYYKAHPHDACLSGAEKLRIIAASWIPAEVFIDRLASVHPALTVYHFGSTAHMNCLGRYHNVCFESLQHGSRYAEVLRCLGGEA